MKNFLEGEGLSPKITLKDFIKAKARNNVLAAKLKEVSVDAGLVKTVVDKKITNPVVGKKLDVTIS